MQASSRSWELAVPAAALIIGVGFALHGSAVGASDGTADLRIKIALGAAAIVLVLFGRRPWLRDSPRTRGALHIAIALLGIAAYANLGVFRHGEGFGFLNRAELFHYQLGARFFPELGHDGLYVASLTAQRRSHPRWPLPARIRDLRTNQLAPVPSLQDHAREVRLRFSQERWEVFVADHARYLDALSAPLVDSLRRDHGYNPPPSWTFVGRLFAAHTPSTPAGLGFLASLDVVLMVAAFAAVWRTFGGGVGCLCLAIFGLGYGWRSLHTGAFLRLDWLAAVLAGACLLERRRFAGAGALFGYAAAVRIFPALFLMGPALLGVKALLRREVPVWALRLATAFLLVVGLGVVAGGLAGRGFGAWQETWENLQSHRELWPPNRVSLDNVVVNLPYLYDHFVEGGAPAAPRLRSVEQVLATKRARGGVATGLKIAWLLLLGAAMWRAPPTSAAVLGMGAVFALTPVGGYYWVMLLAIPLRRETPAVLAVLLLGIGLYAYQLHLPQARQLEMRFALMSLGLAILLAGWMLPEALRTLRGAPQSTSP